MIPFLHNKKVPIEHKIHIIKESLISAMIWGAEIFIQSRKQCQKMQTIVNNALRNALRIFNKSNAVIPMLIELATPLLWLQIIRRKQLMLNRWIQIKNIPIHDMLQNIDQISTHTRNSLIKHMINLLQQHNILLTKPPKKRVNFPQDSAFTYLDEDPIKATLYYNHFMYIELNKKIDKIKAHKHYLKIKTADAISSLQYQSKQFYPERKLYPNPNNEPYKIDPKHIINHYNSKIGSVKQIPKYTRPYAQSTKKIIHPPIHLKIDLSDTDSVLSENDLEIQDSELEMTQLEQTLLLHPIPITQDETNSKLRSETKIKNNNYMPIHFEQVSSQSPK